MVTPAARRRAVAHAMQAHGVSERRACSILAIDRSSVRYRSTRPDDAAVHERMRAVAAPRRRFGDRRLQIMLAREGLVMNHKKFRRLHREERLQVKRRGGRKRALGTRTPILLPGGPNQRTPSLSGGSSGLALPHRFPPWGMLPACLLDLLWPIMEPEHVRSLLGDILVLCLKALGEPAKAHDRLQLWRDIADRVPFAMTLNELPGGRLHTANPPGFSTQVSLVNPLKSNRTMA